MNIQTAARRTRNVILDYQSDTPPIRSEKGEGLQHAHWMLVGIIEGYIQGEKAHRWLGYAQAVCVTEGAVALAEAKIINHEA